MPAYWIARSRVDDAVQYKKYAEQVPAIVASHGGKFLARGGRYQLMEGAETVFKRFVIIEFPSFEAGVACFESPQYQKAAGNRRNGGGVVEVIMLDGGEATR
jgi:uncharacterized protein (DUF1330 family)